MRKFRIICAQLIADNIGVEIVSHDLNRYGVSRFTRFPSCKPVPKQGVMAVTPVNVVGVITIRKIALKEDDIWR